MKKSWKGWIAAFYWAKIEIRDIMFIRSSKTLYQSISMIERQNMLKQSKSSRNSERDANPAALTVDERKEDGWRGSQTGISHQRTQTWERNWREPQVSLRFKFHGLHWRSNRLLRKLERMPWSFSRNPKAEQLHSLKTTKSHLGLFWGPITSTGLISTVAPLSEQSPLDKQGGKNNVTQEEAIQYSKNPEFGLLDGVFDISIASYMALSPAFSPIYYDNNDLGLRLWLRDR